MGTVRSRWSSAPDTRLACRPADGPAEIAMHHRIRHEVFVREQALFPVDDTDVHDAHAATIHVLGFDDGVPAGTVRLYPLGDRLWKGDRLAVLPDHRHSGLGAPLVRYAVASAGALGGCRMVAQVQGTNVRFFQALGWTAVGEPADYLGLLHQQMSIALQ
ncbi:MAG: MSMEG_0567/Sll0786 family nitrogen starvation N-acetyltransferase [Actinomycetes bacterium]